MCINLYVLYKIVHIYRLSKKKYDLLNYIKNLNFLPEPLLYCETLQRYMYVYKINMIYYYLTEQVQLYCLNLHDIMTLKHWIYSVIAVLIP